MGWEGGRRWRRLKRESTPYFLECIDINKRVIALFFKNNRYYLKKHNITLYSQWKYLRDNGVLIDQGHLRRFHNGTYGSMSLSYFSFICKYWGIDITEFLLCDLEMRDKSIQ